MHGGGGLRGREKERRGVTPKAESCTGGGGGGGGGGELSLGTIETMQ